MFADHAHVVVYENRLCLNKRAFDRNDKSLRFAEMLQSGLRLLYRCDSITLILYYLPRKIRQLIADLQKAGFVNRGGKGSHRVFVHESGARMVVSGKPGSGAQRYQERLLRSVLEASQK